MIEACRCITWCRVEPIDLRGFDHHSACPKFAVTYYAEITLKDGGRYTQPLDKLDVLLDEIREAAKNDGGEWAVKLVEMSRSEYERLPEFTGH